MNTLLLTSNLIDSSRVHGTAQLLGIELLVNADIDHLVNMGSTGHLALVLIDLDTPGLDVAQLLGLLRGLDNPPTTIIAFGPHVERAKLTAARLAGCDEVLPRSEFFERLPDMLSEFGRADD